jgi:hypothetical protein
METTRGKLSLSLENLQVDSFETGVESAELRGTVEANQELGPLTRGCYPETERTCQNTCGCPTWDANSCWPETYCVG